MKNITDIVRASITLLTLLFGYIYFILAAFVYKAHDPQITICVVTLVSSVLGYWLGSSIGSAKKQDTLDAINKNSQADAPPPIVGDTPRDRG